VHRLIAAFMGNAVAVAVLGARYGAGAIPERWLDCAPNRGRIDRVTQSLLSAG